MFKMFDTEQEVTDSHLFKRKKVFIVLVIYILDLNRMMIEQKNKTYFEQRTKGFEQS